MRRDFSIKGFLVFACLSGSLFNSQRRPDAIFGDFNGYWTARSKTTTPPPVVARDNNNLIGFTVGSTTYATGANNKALEDNSGIPAANIIKENYRSFPVSLTIPTPNTATNFLIGMPRFIDGVEQTRTLAPSLSCDTSLGFYLRDGVNGLNLATAVFNIPKQELSFLVNVLADINPNCINDDIPDIIVTQVGATASPPNLDVFKFTDSQGVTIGTPKSVDFSGVAASGQALWNFYSIGGRNCPTPYPAYYSGNPEGFSNTMRDIRVLTFKLSDFGITTENFRSAVKFVQILSGESDVAFSAYSTNSMSMYCLENAVTTGTPVDTRIGITSQGRAGSQTINNNWPMVRKGGFLALESNTKPFVPTRISTANLVNITNPVDGMMVYDTTENCLKIYVNSTIGWRCYNRKTCP